MSEIPNRDPYLQSDEGIDYDEPFLRSPQLDQVDYKVSDPEPYFTKELKITAWVLLLMAMAAAVFWGVAGS